MERAVEWDVDQGKVQVRVGDRIIEGDEEEKRPHLESLEENSVPADNI